VHNSDFPRWRRKIGPNPIGFDAIKVGQWPKKAEGKNGKIAIFSLSLADEQLKRGGL
jgi:hypothetical protein